MKAHLLYPDRDFAERELTAADKILMQDLELATIIAAMAGGDELIEETAKTVLFTGLKDTSDILYRQAVLQDCIKNPETVREMYAIAAEAAEERKKNWWGVSSVYLSSTLNGAVSLLQGFVRILRKLRRIADDHVSEFDSEGFKAIFAMLRKELSDEYFAEVEKHLAELKFKNGILISARPGSYNQGTDYVLCRPFGGIKNRLTWKFSHSLTLNPRDDSGTRDLSKRRDRAINQVTNALAQSADHVLSFFTMMQRELAFYTGCLNLYEKLTAKEEPVSFPVPSEAGTGKYTVRGLYDAALSLITENRVTGNDVNADGKNLFIITGANQGGKSTFLRSAGQAQLMMQCGIFTPAESFSADVCTGLYTHYKKEEDQSMKSGKLDEELSRMDDIAALVKPGSCVLFNESFAATNEREGSEISRQIISALMEKNIRVFFVTHLYELSHGFYKQGIPGAVFLRAERQPDGTRTFRLTEGEPLPTSFGGDLYQKIFTKKGGPA